MLYSETVVTGFTDNLPTIQVRLPLKYFSSSTASSNDGSSSTSSSKNEKFQLKLANKGSFIPISGDNIIQEVSYVLLNDLRTIRLTPVFESNHLQLKFQQVEILLPHKVSSTSCLSIILSQEGSESPFLLVDIIDENFLFISVKIQLDDFIVNSSSSKPFQLDKFKYWGQISVPYSFELRSSPFYIKSISVNDLIVSLKDGGLLHFKRSSPLSDYHVHNFHGPTSLLPFNILGGLLWKDRKGSEQAQEAGNGGSGASDFLGGISTGSVVDIAPLSPTTFVALTVNKELKVWDLNTHRQSAASIDLKSNPKDTSFWLTASSTVKYLQVLNGRYLACHFISKSTTNTLTDEDVQSNKEFKVWEIDANAQLHEIHNLKFKPQPPSERGVGNTNNISGCLWFIQDFHASVDENNLVIHILWKSNTSSILSVSSLDLATGSLKSTEWSSKPYQQSVLSTFSPYFESNYYSDKILNSGNYNDLIVKTSLDIFRDHIGFKDNDLSLTNLSLRQSILGTINADGGEGNAKLNWFKLDSLCEEYKKLSEECLSLSIRDGIFILNTNSYCYVRPSHSYEEALSSGDFYHQNPELQPESSEDKISSLLSSLSVNFSTKTFIKLYNVITETPKFTTEKVSEVYSTLIASKLSKDASNSLVEKFVNIPNILEVVNDLVEPRVGKEGSKKSEVDTSASIYKLITIMTFKDIKRSHESILLELFVLLLLMELNDTILELINKLASRLTTYKLLNTVFDTSYSVSKGSGSFSGKVERNQLSNLQNSLFWNGVVENFPSLLKKKTSLNTSYDDLYSIIVQDYESFITDIIIELINHDEGDLIKEIFIKNLNSDNVIDKFLIGFVYLISNDSDEFYKGFEEEIFDFKNETVKAELKKKILGALTMNENIRIFLTSIFSSKEDNPFIEKANYYHALSILATSQSKKNHNHTKFISPIASTFLAPGDDISSEITTSGSSVSFLKTSLKFELLAITSLESIQKPNDKVQITLLEFNKNLFEMALNVNEYDLVYKSLQYLNEHKISGSVDLEAIFTKFINNVISNRCISILFSPSSKSIKQLFANNYLLIDSILLGLANNELALSNSLKYYEYLYSWRLFGCATEEAEGTRILGDKRGAVEALYIFITRFRHEHQNLLQYDEETGNLVDVDEDIKQYKLKVLELYMIILNCLKSFDKKEDQWIIKSTTSVDLEVSTLKDLTKEYIQWLKELQDDIREWNP